MQSREAKILELALQLEGGIISEEEIRLCVIKIYQSQVNTINLNKTKYECHVDRLLLSFLEKALDDATNETEKKQFLKIAKTYYQYGELPKPPNHINDSLLCLYGDKTLLDFHEHSPLSAQFFLEHIMKQDWFKNIIPLIINVGAASHIPQDKKDQKGKGPVGIMVKKFFTEQNIEFKEDKKCIIVEKLPKNWKFLEILPEQKEEQALDERQMIPVNFKRVNKNEEEIFLTSEKNF